MLCTNSLSPLESSFWTTLDVSDTAPGLWDSTFPTREASSVANAFRTSISSAFDSGWSLSQIPNSNFSGAFISGFCMATELIFWLSIPSWQTLKYDLSTVIPGTSRQKHSQWLDETFKAQQSKTIFKASYCRGRCPWSTGTADVCIPWERWKELLKLERRQRPAPLDL